MKFGTYTFSCDGLSMEERLERIRACGYDFVALNFEPGLSDHVKHCEKIGLPIENIHLKCNGTSKLWLDDDSGEEIVESYCDQIRVCTDLGIRIGIAHPTWGKHILPPNERGLRRYERIVECAEKYDFILAVENTKSREHLTAIVDHFDSPNVLFCWDSGHETGYDPGANFLDRYGDRLCALHLHDNRAERDLHIAPFDGEGDWEKAAKGLAKTAYGREKLCAEPGGRIRSKREGMTASEIRELFLPLAAVDDERLIRFYDGYYTVYENMSFDEICIHFLEQMKKLAAMIEKEA